MKNNIIKPNKKENITIQNLGDEVILYDPDMENVHILNQTAQTIWALCNGENTIDDIQKKLIENYPDASQDDLYNDVIDTIDDFNEKKMLV